MLPNLENLFIYPTWKCNLNCAHCWIDKDNERTKLSVDLIEKALFEALNLGLRYIKLSGGEPLLCEEIVQYIASFAQNNNVNISIETNGTLINDKWVEIFNNSNTLVSVSIDSYDENAHDNFRGMKGAFSLSINAIKQLVSHNVRVGIVTSISKIDYKFLDNMIEFASDLKVANLKINPIVKIGNAKKLNDTHSDDTFIFSLSSEEMIKVKNKYCNNSIYKIPVSLMLPVGLSGIRRLLSPQTTAFSCANCPTLNLLSILPNGDIGLCADASRTGSLLFGNLFKESITQIWNQSYEVKQLRDCIPENLDGACKVCMVRELCKGSCRAISIKAGGKVNSPHPICQKLYEENKFFLVNKGANIRDE